MIEPFGYCAFQLLTASVLTYCKSVCEFTFLGAAVDQV